jgi:hypothetical protein
MKFCARAPNINGAKPTANNSTPNFVRIAGAINPDIPYNTIIVISDDKNI